MTPRVAQLPLSTLEDGDVITGVISDVWLYHGCQVDFGYEFDGFVIKSESTSVIVIQLLLGSLSSIFFCPLSAEILYPYALIPAY
jgi:hypothetical protein